MRRLRGQADSRHVEHMLREHEEAGTTSDPAYARAVGVLYGRHVCRLDPWPIV